MSNQQKLTGLRPFYVMEITGHAAQIEASGRTVMHMESGEPGAPPAPRVREAVAAALDQPQKYTHSAGQIELRRALVDYYKAQHGVAVDPGSLMVTMGSSSGFILAFLAAFGRGAKIAVTRPGYPAYLNTLDGLGMEAVEIPVTAEAGWRLTASDIEAAYAREKFDGLLFASPANPTGAAVTREGLREIVEVCARLGVRFISDEIYHGLDYRGPSVSALEFTRDAIVINSFSKYYCMTGWRIGWMVLPEDIFQRAYMLQQNLFIAAPTLSQIAGRVALGERDYSEEQKAQYAVNRHALAEGLAQFGLATASEGDGAFYAYVDFSRYTNDSLGFCLNMLDEVGVAATPGIDFDRLNGNRFVRFSYAGTRATIDEGLNRIESFLKRR
ncbi:aminotransferase class I/II-fold pyridoxal phosphate-dependent enzyme [Devosia sp.]|uniref:pyridoxal phosphate-dependent aminotransferase n=1 Tax=Devosia sp. TaxID=1871048 RepID=UPI0025C2012E|nr:aminotransferase class I/II-fold pyridoxal phosphate-dependent enzyme [Devosia sp.]